MFLIEFLNKVVFRKRDNFIVTTGYIACFFEIIILVAGLEPNVRVNAGNSTAVFLKLCETAAR